MNFANPAALWGLLALGVPVIVHLFSFKYTKRVFFSNVALLHEIKEENKRRRLLRERLLLVSRLLAVFCLVMAFAQPQFGTAQSSKAASGHHAIFVDNSPSMSLQGNAGMLLEQAREAARAIALAAQPDERFQLLTQELAPLSTRWMSRDAFLQALDELQPVHFSQPAATLLQRQIDLAMSSGLTNAKLYWISDFQKSAFDLAALKLPEELSLQLLQLEAATVSNLYVDSAWLDQPLLRKGQKARLVFKVVNGGGADALGVRVQLEIGGVQKGLATMDLPANGALTDTIDFTPESSGRLRARLQLNDRVFPIDDTWYLQLTVKDSLSLLYISPDKPSPYLQALFSNDDFVQFQRLARLGLDYNALSKYAAFVLEGGDAGSTGLVETLLKQVEAGGTLIYLPAPADQIQDIQAVLQALGVASPTALEQGQFAVRKLAFEDRLFQETFSSIPEQLALPTATKYVKYSLQPEDRVLMQLQNDDPWLIRRDYGSGSITLLMSALSPAWTDFVQHALLVPTFHRASQLGGELVRSSYRLNQADAIALRAADVPVNGTIALEKEQESFIPEIRRMGGRVLLNARTTNLSPGHYQLVSDKLEGGTLQLAFNADAAESRLQYWSTAELENVGLAKGWNPLQIKEATLAGKLTVNTEQAGFWKWLLLFVLVFLLSETLILQIKR